MTSPAFSFYAKDWLAATMSWSLEARGAYMTLLAYQWDAGFVPAGDAALARLLAVRATKARAIWAVIGSKFCHGSDGKLQNVRLEIERRKQAERKAQLAENGSKGGRPKNQKVSSRFPKQKPNGNQNESLASSSSSSFASSPHKPPKGKSKNAMPRFVTLGARRDHAN